MASFIHNRPAEKRTQAKKEKTKFGEFEKTQRFVRGKRLSVVK